MINGLLPSFLIVGSCPKTINLISSDILNGGIGSRLESMGLSEKSDVFFRVSLIFKDSLRIFWEDVSFTQILYNWNQFANKIYFYNPCPPINPDEHEDVNEFIREWKTYPPAKELGDFQRIANVFEPLRNNFKLLGQYDDEDDCYYEYMDIKRYHSTGWTWIRLTFIDLICGYGVKELRPIKASAYVILFFAFFYNFRGGIRERKFDNAILINDETFLKNIGNALYFSITTFTTIGYGDWYPSEERIPIKKVYFSKFKLLKLNVPYPKMHKDEYYFKIPFISFRILAMIEGLLGWFLLAVFIITLGRIYIR